MNRFYRAVLCFSLCLMILTVLTPMPSALAAGSIAIDEDHFSDSVFRSYVASSFDKNQDGVLDTDEINRATTISISKRAISSLKGIEYLTGLTKLVCDNTYLTSLDLNKNTALTYLNCSYTDLTSLNVSKNIVLTYLNCSDTNVTSLNLSNNTKLITLICYNDKYKNESNYDKYLNGLDVSRNTALETLNCSGNHLTSLNLTSNTALTKLYCYDNSLTSLNLSKNTALTELSCYKNSLTSLNLSSNTKLERLECYDNKLTSLNVSKCTELDYLMCNNNSLTSLDVSKCTALVNLSCNNNSLTSLDVSKNTALVHFSCSNNSLTSLDVSKNTKLYTLSCGNNNLTSLNMSNISALKDLSCNNNSLTSLDLSNNRSLKTLSCHHNKLTCLDLSNNRVLESTYIDNNARTVTAPGGVFDLSTLQGFDVSRAFSWSAGTVNGSELIMAESGTVTYTYECKQNLYTIFTLNVKVTAAKPTISTQPKAATVAEGATATFNVTAKGEDLQYQWYYKKPGDTSWTAVSWNGTSAIYSLTTETRHDGYTYCCRVKNDGGQVYSSSVKLTVVTKPAITTQPKSVTVAAGKTATFTVAASGGGISWQWYYKKPGDTSWTAVSNNGTSASYSLATEERHDGYTYCCRAKNAAGQVYSISIKLTVVTKPAITAHPKSVTVAAGETAAFTVTASGKSLSYQWFYKKPGDTEWTEVSWNGTSASYSLATETRHDGYIYRCRVKNIAGQVYSNSVNLTVVSKPAITTQPKSVTVTEGATATFTAAAAGGSLNWQWYYKKPGATEWTAVSSNGTSATYSLTAAARHNGYTYCCRAKNTAGQAFTSSVTLTVTPAITTQPTSQTVGEGATATFKVVASGTSLTYQWHYQKPGESTWIAVSSNGISATYSLTTEARHDGYAYRCKITNSGGGSVYSNIVKLTVVTKPVFTTQPKAKDVAAGDTATFKVAASGGSIGYQWYYKKPGETEWTAVSQNGTSATYSLTAETRHDGYTYCCRAKNAAGQTFSRSVILTVVSAPAISTQTTAVTITAGGTANFKIVATGGGLSYQWYYLRPGETTWRAVSSNGTDAIYSLVTESRHNGYQYKCTVTNAAGSATSSIATLTVK